MRQGLLVVIFVSYSLLAFAQGPGGGSGQLVLERLTLSSQEISDFDKIARELGYFPTGTTNHTVPSIEQFQRDYQAKYKKSADAGLLRGYNAYREHRSRPVGMTITMHTYDPNLHNEMAFTQNPTRGELVRLAVNGNLAFMMAMAEKNGTEITPRMDEDCAGQTQLNRCPLTPPGYSDLSDKRGPDVLMRSQADCFERIANEIGDAHPLCARNMHFAVERYRFLINFKYPNATGGTGARVATQPGGGRP